MSFLGVICVPPGYASVRSAAMARIGLRLKMTGSAHAATVYVSQPVADNCSQVRRKEYCSVAGVARTGIAEPDEKQHGILSVRSCPRKRASSNLGPREQRTEHSSNRR
jgi:hypothetical protein